MAPRGQQASANAPLTLQIIVASMAIGLLAFGAVALLQRPEPRDNPLSLMMLGLGALAILARFVVPSLIVAQASRSLVKDTGDGRSSTTTAESDRLLQVYMTKTILGVALLEGAGFANILAYLVAGQRLNLFAGIVLLLALLASIPRQASIAAWIDDQSRRIRQERSLSRRDQ